MSRPLDYYEEFGIPRDASAEQIRQTYRAVTRVLHPDTQPDAALKLVAECQMKRVNEVFAVLLDAHRRCIYDQTCNSNEVWIPWVPSGGLPHPVATSSPRRPRVRYGFWLVIALMSFGSAAWYIGVGYSTQTDASQAEILGGGGLAAAPYGQLNDSSSAVNADAASSGRNASPLVGTWLYYPHVSGSKEQVGVNRPVYVELRLSEDHGMLRGRFQGRYQSERYGVAPEILLDAKGWLSSGPVVKLFWTGTNGSRGEMELAPQGRNAIRAIWRTTVAGAHSSPSSDTALLLRQDEP